MVYLYLSDAFYIPYSYHIFGPLFRMVYLYRTNFLRQPRRNRSQSICLLALNEFKIGKGFIGSRAGHGREG